MTEPAPAENSAQAAGLAPIIAFGISGKQVEHVDEERVAYRCGHHIAIAPKDGAGMRFVMEDRSVRATGRFAVSPNLRYLAASERSGSTARITIFSLGAQYKKIRTLQYTDSPVKDFLDVCFSGDSKYMVAIGSAPDYPLIYWNWEKGKVLATVKIQVPVTKVSFSPYDNAQLAVSGPRFLRIFRSMEGQLKAFNPIGTKREPQNYTDHQWVTEDMLIVATDSGDVLVVDDGDLKHSLPGVITEGIFCLTAFSRGFLAGGAGGFIVAFEKTDDQEYFTMIRKLKPKRDLGRLVCISVSESEETAVLSFDSRQLATMQLSRIEVAKEEDDLFTVMFGGFHSGPITGLDVCLRRPLVITCSSDKSIRVWNYNTRKCELLKQFSEEAYCLSVHPLGTYVVAGFADKLRLMNVVIGDITEEHSFNLKGCREVSFSHSGHLFAAANGTNILVFSTYTFQNVAYISKGHIGPVTGLCWSNDDRMLASSGYDGCLYEWDTQMYQKKHEHVNKGCKYSSVAYSKGAVYLAATGSDQRLRVVNSGSIVADEPADSESTCRRIMLSNNNISLFGGTEKGDLQLRNFPLRSTETPFVFPTHQGPVTRLGVTADDAMVFSAGEDGTLWMFEQTPSDRRGAEMPPFSEIVNITQTELSDKVTTIGDLKAKMEQMAAEFDYELKKREREQEDRMREHNAEIEKDLRAMELKYRALRQEKETQQLEAANVVQQMETMHMKAAEELEALYERKLMAEVQRYQRLDQDREEMHQQHVEQTMMTEKHHQLQLQELRDEYEHRIQEQELQIKGLEEDIEELKRDFQEQIRQQEDEYESELHLEQESTKRKVQGEREVAVGLRSENTQLRTKEKDARSEMEETKQRLLERDQTIGEMAKQAKEYEKQILLLQKNIRERDEAISQNERRIFQLKQQNHELEKFKFVLDYKIKELRDEMEPREQQLHANRESMRAMEQELLAAQRRQQSLETNVNDRTAKMEVLNRELAIARQQLSDRTRLNKLIVREVDLLYKHTEPALWKQGFRDLWQRFASEKQQSKVDDEEEQARNHEFARQREHMEKTISAMRRTVEHVTDQVGKKEKHAHNDNVLLLTEVNDLRREKRALQLRVNELESQLKEAQFNALRTKRSRPKTSDTEPDQSPARRSGSGKLVRGSTKQWSAQLSLKERTRMGDMVNQLDYNSREMEMQRLEIKRLRDQMQGLIDGEHDSESGDDAGAAAVGGGAISASPSIRLPSISQ
eukprot:TRINITY_DN15065_c0_g1_i1.p1 TRINITY_DN15065_c0_g1~~TRINITY_DN15065_c0_g1_i1.p1  ORF type:complete len:1237 (-),score=364.60 TRINITY_DN15065_c0_g1_i1:70-3780(-)